MCLSHVNLVCESLASVFCDLKLMYLLREREREKTLPLLILGPLRLKFKENEGLVGELRKDFFCSLCVQKR
jgi:hypothetical protein